ncbi:hypothetical protein M0802_015256 [Mischocyttarus mexicanus]|nr:hypothetical protein M0802_015256 [Mischocyttarus mexicanus]
MDSVQEKFAEKLKALPVSANNAYMSSEKYEKLVEKEKCVQVSDQKKPMVFSLLKHYDVIRIQGVEKFIFPVTEH